LLTYSESQLDNLVKKIDPDQGIMNLITQPGSIDQKKNFTTRMIALRTKLFTLNNLLFDKAIGFILASRPYQFLDSHFDMTQTIELSYTIGQLVLEDTFGYVS